MKIIITHDKDYKDYKALSSSVSQYVVGKRILEIVVRGINTLGEQYATKHDLRLSRFPSNTSDEELCRYAQEGILIHFNQVPKVANCSMAGIASKYDIHVVIFYRQ